MGNKKKCNKNNNKNKTPKQNRRNIYRDEDYNWKLIKEFIHVNALRIMEVFDEIVSDVYDIPPENFTTVESDDGRPISMKIDDFDITWLPLTLLLEVATIDTDDYSLKFDHLLANEAYMYHKVRDVIDSQVKFIKFCTSTIKTTGNLTEKDIADFYNDNCDDYERTSPILARLLRLICKGALLK